MPQPLACNRPANADHAQLYEILVGELTDFVVFLVDPDGCVVSWNPGVERILGYKEEEWIGQSLEQIFTPEDRAHGKPQQELITAEQEGRAPDIRWHLRKNGERMYAEGTMVALRDPSGKLLGFSKVLRDATERRKRELALEDAVRYAESIVDTIRHPLLVLDNSLCVRSGNQSFYRLFKVSSETTHGRPLHELGNGQWNIPKLQALLEEILREDKVVADFEVEHEFPEIGRKLMLLNARKLSREEGHTELILLAFEDITERRQLLQETQRSNAELTEFAHVVSHDLQTPIRGVRSFTELLARHCDGQLDDTAQEYLKFIGESTKSMTSLIRTLLGYATAGQGELTMGPAPLNAVLNAAVTSIDPLIAETGAAITSDSLPTVQGDRVLLQQLLQNLLSNALKYRKPGEVPEVLVQARAKSNMWVISIKDNGIGVDPHYHRQIFAPLKRVHGTKVEGTGIGLAVCKRIVERHGGRIWVNSQAGQGSTFAFTLPM